MKRLLIALTFLVSGQVYSQPTDSYIKTIEKLRSKGTLTTKSSIDKTFVGSVTGYYDKDSIVLINSLTDAEAAGTETLYFIKDGTLKKVYVMAATFDSNGEWKEYYSKHKSVDNCYQCHGKPNCIVTEITFGDQPTVFVTENKRKRELNGDEKEKMLLDVKRTCDELKVLVKELD
jgi:antitoxin component YwqK of YwqJK toxin-antitoxin module